MDGSNAKWPELATLVLWQCGYLVKELMPSATYYRHREKLLELGVDISTLPLRPRVPGCDLRDIFSKQRRVIFRRDLRRRLLVPEWKAKRRVMGED